MGGRLGSLVPSENIIGNFGLKVGCGDGGLTGSIVVYLLVEVLEERKYTF
jgi:hypothetical protein